MELDMHFHSTHSDGSSTPDELLQRGKNMWMKYLFLTDHDKISTDFAEKAKIYWIQSCESVEISALNKQQGFSFHVTFYAQKIWEEVEKVINHTIQQKIILIQKQIEALNNVWFEIDIETFYLFCKKNGRKNDTINKFDLATFVLCDEHNTKIAYSLNNNQKIWVETFYEKFLKKNGEKFSQYGVLIDDYEVSLETCCQIKNNHSCILSLAHPNFTFRKWIEDFEKNLSHYIEIGWINAIEINTKATKLWIEAILKMKQKYGLYLTFWSDCHHLDKSNNKHGNFWEINPFLSSDFIKTEFWKYKNILGIQD